MSNLDAGIRYVSIMVIETIKKYFLNTDKPVYGRVELGESSTQQVDAVSREKAYFNDAALQQQRLYEKWVCREKWLLQSEGIPLLLGKDPDKVSGTAGTDICDENHDTLWEHACRCVEQNLLSVTHSEGPPETWEIKPADLYRWASISRISIPEPLVRLMEFVLHAVKMTQPETASCGMSMHGNDSNENQTSEKFHLHREFVLGAALAILARYPDRCRNSKGRIKSELIVNLMEEMGSIWFGDEEQLLSRSARQDLLDKYLKTIE